MLIISTHWRSAGEAGRSQYVEQNILLAGCACTDLRRYLLIFDSFRGLDCTNGRDSAAFLKKLMIRGSVEADMQTREWSSF